MLRLKIGVNERDDLVGLLGGCSGNEGMGDGMILTDFLCCFKGNQDATVGVTFLEIVDQNIRNNLRRPTNLGLGRLGCIT